LVALAAVCAVSACWATGTVPSFDSLIWLPVSAFGTTRLAGMLRFWMSLPLIVAAA
jgi:hypothetical protein